MNTNKLWWSVTEAVAAEKGLPVERVAQALEEAMGAWLIKHVGREGQCQVSGVSQGELVARFRSNDDAPWESIPWPAPTRTAAQAVKQGLYQRLAQASRSITAERWDPRVGELIAGSVKRVSHGTVVLDLGLGDEGTLTAEHRLEGGFLRIGQTVRAVVHEVNDEGRGPVVSLSRTSDAYLLALLEREVPEIRDGRVDIRALARAPGRQAKVVLSAAAGFNGDPVAVCVGMRGLRVHAIAQDLGQERLDLVVWHDDPVERIVACLGEVEPRQLVLDEERGEAWVSVTQWGLARAIGRQGQNVRLASKASGWRIEVMEEGALVDRMAQDRAERMAVFQERLDVDASLAEALIEGGIDTLAGLAAMDGDEVQRWAAEVGLPPPEADELARRARAVWGEEEAARAQAQACALEQRQSLLDLGVTCEQADRLGRQGVNDAAALADCAVDDIQLWAEVTRAQVGGWILAARDAVAVV